MKESPQKNQEKKLATHSDSEVMVMFETLNDGIKVIGEQYGEVIKRLDNHDSRFDSLENKVDQMQEDVTEIKHKLSEKVDREEFEKLEKRIIKLEKLVFAKLN